MNPLYLVVIETIVCNENRVNSRVHRIHLNNRLIIAHILIFARVNARLPLNM